MNGKNNGYDWTAYYKAVYEKEHKKNIMLAGKIADAEKRQADYSDNLNRICSNPFWKMTAPARKLYHVFKGGVMRIETGVLHRAPVFCVIQKK